MKSAATAWGTGFFSGNFANPNLKWEETKAYNVGLDLSLFNNRIEFIVGCLSEEDRQPAHARRASVYILNNTGWKGISAPKVNTGAIENKGIEFTLNTVNIQKNDFEWRTGATSPSTATNSPNSTPTMPPFPETWTDRLHSL